MNRLAAFQLVNIWRGPAHVPVSLLNCIPGAQLRIDHGVDCDRSEDSETRLVSQRFCRIHNNFPRPITVRLELDVDGKKAFDNRGVGRGVE